MTDRSRATASAALPASGPTIKKAASFLRRHPDDPVVRRAFGRLAEHPAARLNQRRLQALLDAVAFRSGQLGRPLRVLDAACGGGLITCAFAGAGHRALGIDADTQEIRVARLFAQEEKLDGMFLRKDILQDPDWERIAEDTLGGKPDIVALADALHRLPEVSPLLKRLSRWLEPGSQLLVSEENPEAPLFKLQQQLRRWMRKEADTRWHRPFADWRRLLEAHGFQIVGERRGLGPLPSPLNDLMRVNPDKSWSIVFTAQRS